MKNLIVTGALITGFAACALAAVSPAQAVQLCRDPNGTRPSTYVSAGSCFGGSVNAVAASTIVPVPSATGQIFRSTNGSSITALNIGTTGQVLTVVSGVPAWATTPAVKYLIAGTAPASTYHCVTSPAAGYTAVGTPQAVVFSGAAVFSGFYTLALNDNGPTGFTVPAITAKVTTGFTFTATNFASDTYSFLACGE
jgi:hypothetical protein